MLLHWLCAAAAAGQRPAQLDLWQSLGIAARLPRPSGRAALPMQAAAEGSAGLRVLTVYDWLYDPKRTCLPQDAQARAAAAGDRKGLGAARCPEGALSVPREAGDATNATAGAAVTGAAALISELLASGGTSEQAAVLAASTPQVELMCARYVPEIASFYQARDACATQGGVVVTMSAAATEQVLRQYSLQYGVNDTFWTGLRVLDAASRPVATAWESGQPTDAWNSRWNVAPGAAGESCCPGADEAFGDATCVVYDAVRARAGLRPYVIRDCAERHPYYCEVATEFYDTTTGGEVVVSTDAPQHYYAPQPPASLEIYDRTPGSSGRTTAECSPLNSLDAQKRDLVLRQVEAAAAALIPAMLSPLRRGAGIGAITSNQGGGTFECMDPYFTFDLSSRMTPPADPNATASLELPGYDLVLFVTAAPDTDAAWSFTCQVAADMRPTVVVLNVAPNRIPAAQRLPRGDAQLRARILQALFHALGLHTALWPGWAQARVNATKASRSCIINAASCRNITLLVTPAATRWLQQVQFRCEGNPLGGSGTTDGAELEDAMITPPVALPYWEKRIFRGEVMTMLPDLAYAQAEDVPVVSGLTLAAFEDTGWYQVNHKMAQVLRWGRLQRCEFATHDCGEWPQRYRLVPSSPPGPQQLQCSADFLSLASSSIVTWPQRELPARFRWLGALRPLDGGRDRLMDFCPVLQPTAHSCLQAMPADPDCQNLPCRNFDVRGVSSRCVMSTLRYKVLQSTATSATVPARGTCLPTECQRSAAGYVLGLWIAGRRYDCAKKGESVGPSRLSGAGALNPSNFTLLGVVTCPDPREVCEEAGPEAAQEACDPFDDCGARGWCTASGKCECFAPHTLPGPDPSRPHVGSRGFYAGSRCERCFPGYWGWPRCASKACPRSAATGLMCHSRGDCDGVTGECRCWDDDKRGHWGGPSCADCRAGWVGGSCRILACRSDGDCGRGTCLALGQCRCFSGAATGWWTGPRCNRCAPGYDIENGCRSRIASYYACDSHLVGDCITAPPAALNCTACLSRCAARGAACSVPLRQMPQDARGCLIDGRSGRCEARQQDCGPCPLPAPILIDCQGFPNPYVTCWEADDCGCLPPAFVQCAAGTDAAPSPTSHALQVATADGAFDPRPAAAGAGTCRCPDAVPAADIDCWGPTAAAGGPAYAWRRVVYWEPRDFQAWREDFCRCTSPSLPRCSAATAPQLLPELRFGVHVDCTALLARSGCPDWEVILNVGRRHRPLQPDLSELDCGGWPPPSLRSDKDPCGCPFPTFRCIPGTEGSCPSPPQCPEWPRVAVDCGGRQPPVVARHAPHPCGCPPPPPISCLPGTGPCCECEAPPAETQWVDCRGTPLEPPPWDPEHVYPRGDPAVQPCDPCPHCVSHPPTRRCIPGTEAPLPPSANQVSHCPGGPPDLTTCPVHPPPCPVDCGGAPPPPPPWHDPCECPPPPQPACLPGTFGLLSLRAPEAAPCASAPALCGAYACAAPASGPPPSGGSGRGVPCGERQARWGQQPAGLRRCVQSCATDYDCACGFKCSVCGLCVGQWWPAVPEGGNCLADGGASCGRFACSVRCGDPEHLRAVMEDATVAAVCLSSCRAHEDCAPGMLCTFPVTHGVPASADGGDCVPNYLGAGPTAVAFCYSHADCGGYACGAHSGQRAFAASRCRSSCWVDAHCAPGWVCSRAAARCRPTGAEQEGCADDPRGLLLRHGGCGGAKAAVGCGGTLLRYGLEGKLAELCPQQCGLCPSRPVCADDAQGWLLAVYGATPRARCQLLKLSVGCAADAAAHTSGAPPGALLSSVCPFTCGVCTLDSAAGSTAATARRLLQAADSNGTATDPPAGATPAPSAGGSRGPVSCSDDPGGRLYAQYGPTGSERCAAVVRSLTCEADALPAGAEGTTVGLLCPTLCDSACATPQPPPTPTGDSAGRAAAPPPADPCISGHAEREGASSGERCVALRGCCYRPDFDICMPCAAQGAAAPPAAPEGGGALGRGCAARHAAFCAPYVCGGHRGAAPQPGAACPTSCGSDEGCMAFHSCRMPPLRELRASDAGGVLSLGGGGGSCVPTGPLLRRRQTRAEAARVLEAAVRSGADRPAALLLCPSTAPGEDAQAMCFAHAPYRPPPPPPRPPLDAAPRSGAACAPFAPQPPSVGGCRRSCSADSHCSGGHYCFRPRVPRAPGPAVQYLGSPSPDPAREAPLKGLCLRLHGLGAACAGGWECGSGHCAAGICCNAPCSLPCQTCAEEGVCQWVPPTARGRCSSCQWCNYEGAAGPTAPLGCSPIPAGADPLGDCGVGAVCDGTGTCAATDPRRAPDGRTCALGYAGPACEEDLALWHTAAAAEPLEVCQGAAAAQRASTPFPPAEASPAGGGGCAAAGAWARAADGGIVSQPNPQSALRRQPVADRRPRQWAQRVLAVSGRSQFGCSEVLGPPSGGRAHGPRRTAWAPKQYVAGDPPEHPELQWVPWANCSAQVSGDACNGTAGCRWNSRSGARGWCGSDGTVVTPEQNAAECARLLGCRADGTPLPGTDTLACPEVVTACNPLQPGAEPQWLPSRIAPPPLQWIDLEFPEPVWASAVLIVENSGPGSVVQIQLQPAAQGAAALAAAGGAVGDKTVTAPEREEADVSVTDAGDARCGAYAAQGRTVCEAQPNCVWDEAAAGSGACAEGLGLCEVGQDRCQALEREGRCYWDSGAMRCNYGRPCIAARTWRAEAARDACAEHRTQSDCTGDSQKRCSWRLREVSACRPWTDHDSCAAWAGDRTRCESQVRGTAADPSRRLQYCGWNESLQSCGERPDTHNCSGWGASAASCNATASCHYVAEQCVPRSARQQPCSQLTAAQCVGCALSGGAPGCSVQCEWETLEETECVPYDSTLCQALPQADCIAAAACTWAGTVAAAEAAAAEQEEGALRRRALALQEAARGARRPRAQQDAATPGPPGGTPAPPPAAGGEDAAGAAAPAAEMKPSDADTVGSLEESPVLKAALWPHCQLDADAAKLRQESDPSDITDWATVCEAQRDRVLCLAQQTWKGVPGVCVWPTTDEVAAMDGVPSAGRSEWGELGTLGAAEAATAMRWHHLAPRWPEELPPIATRRAAGLKPPRPARCEDMPEGGSDPAAATTINTNTNSWRTVWQRSWPNFPLRPIHRAWEVPVGAADFRTRAVRLWLAPVSGERTQIDAVALIGGATKGARCGGEVWVAPTAPPGVDAATRGAPWAVPCGGRGRCGPHGCECLGNFFGAGCESCRFGWEGPACDHPIDTGCRVVGAEDTGQFHDAEELKARWGFADYRYWESGALPFRHFGSTLSSPRYQLGDRTHVRLEVGVLLVDLPKGLGDCGVEVAAAEQRGTPAGEWQLLYTRPCKHFTGANLVGSELGDIADHFTVLRRWEKPTIALQIKLWAGIGLETPAFTVTDFVVHSCRYPDTRK
eukprot:TRINITY_DN16398_c1_g1_i1.p1 TRINITY_DN16398_c1_g1~~TRINITY_DN16398_c1_g1_i1.p1  ORF type:complete len:3421 (+),score=748.10 TRINITY_DN16398_c1_g1_i1:92-10354(+)